MKISDFLSGPFALMTEPSTATIDFHGVYATDLLSAAIKSAHPKDVLVTIISHQNTIGVAMMIDLSGVIIAESRPLSDIMIEKANMEHIAIIQTHLKTHEVIAWMVKRGML
jgi:hypothetical protein